MVRFVDEILRTKGILSSIVGVIGGFVW